MDFTGSAAIRDVYNLQRFVEAQDPVFEQVCSELRAGRKTSHWMWFVFPQLRGLGHSPLADKFGIASLDQAKAYLDHAILGPRLRECTRLVNAVQGRSIEEIFGYPDDLKFRSSITLTLFFEAAADNRVFKEALAKYFASEPDRLTLEALGK